MSAVTDAFTRRSVLEYQNGRSLLSLRGTFRDLVPAPPKEMQVLLERAPHTTTIRVTYPDGQTEVLPHNSDVNRLLVLRGVPPDKVQRALDYVWNMRFVYVTCLREPAPISKPVLTDI